MKKRIASIVLAFAALVGVLASGTSAAQIGQATATDYGSGLWGGPGTSYVQDTGWASSSLRVGIVGDSITVRCAADLRAAFAAEGVSFAVRGHAGQNTAGSNTWLESLTYTPDLLIMATGTNDVFNPFAMPAQIARTKAAAGLGTQIVWVDTFVQRWNSSYPVSMQPHDVRNSGQVNDYIHAAFPPSHVADWNANITATIGRGGEALLRDYLDDGVHPWKDAGDGHADGCANWTTIIMNTVRPLL